MSLIRVVWSKILEILFPRICISCSRYLSQNEGENLLCDACFDSIEILEEVPGARVHSVGLYSSKPLRDLIHGLKFKRYIKAMSQIEKLIHKYFEKNPNSVLKQCDLITFIPLHPERQRKRGFNQAELIARVSENYSHISVQPLLKRINSTQEQSSIKGFPNRAENVRGCFELLVNTPVNQKILLVDDVYTSGSTATEAVRVLRAGNPQSIIVFVLAEVR